MTRTQRDTVVLRNLPATEATLAHLLSSADHARQALASLQSRVVVELAGATWRRRESVRAWRRDYNPQE